MSPHQIFMLRMFEKGWRFKLFNKVRGSWSTYWSLRRRGYIRHAFADDVLTDDGRKVLEKYRERNA